MTDTATTASVDDPKELGSVVARWDEELRAYEKASKDWIKDGKDNYKRYSLRDRSNQPETTADSRFNILWSNVQTQSPALFSRPPVPVVERRFRDKDPVGRIASQMLERAISTDMEFDEVETTGKQITLDFQLVGRGIPWVRYETDNITTETVVEPLDAGFIDGDGNLVEEADEQDDGTFVVNSEEVDRERAPVEYVYWEDFYHKPVKFWKELERDGWVARRVFMTRRQGIERFGEIFKDVPLTATPRGMEEKITDHVAPLVKMAEVFEIWNAADKDVIFIAREFKRRPLERKPDPLGLEKFFPCPRAAYATLTTDSLIPIPDYQQYIDQADELDDLTERIQVLTKALRMKGIYDASMEGLASLLNDSNTENDMIPVTNLAAYLAKGATGTKLTNVVQFFPVEVVAQVILSLYEARDRVKQTLFEISGVPDVIRGQVDPREKLGQSKIKGQFATIRLDDRRQEIARMFRDTIRIKAEIIAEQFDDRMLREISGFDQIQEVISAKRQVGEQAAQQVAQQAKQQADQLAQQNPQLAQLAMQQAQQASQQASEQAAEQMFQSAVQLIRDDKTRGFRIDIETDSTVSIDEQETKEARIEFLSAAGGFLQQAIPAAQQVPQIAPLLGDMLLFAVRGFKAGRPLEAAFEEAVEELKQSSQQPQQDPEAEAERAKAEAEAQQSQIDLQTKQQSAQIDIQKKQAELEVTQQKAAIEMQVAREELVIKQQELALKREELELKAVEIRQKNAA